MDVEAIAPLLEEHVAFAGIDARSMDRARLEWVIGSRCRELGLPDAAAYCSRLAQSELETRALIEALVVPETRFFRDPAVFEHLRTTAAPLANEVAGIFRVLSAPCSTGQEAYSVVATLLRAGLSPGRFLVDAVDISERALRIASHGVYPEPSMRDVAKADRESCAQLRNNHWHIRDDLRSRVRFEHRNLAEPGALRGQTYHLIVCRNLFIYFHREAREALGASLAAALAPEGLLILGPGDLVPEIRARFTPLRPASSFAFRHAKALPREVPTALPISIPISRPDTRGRVTPRSHAPESPPTPQPPPGEQEASAEQYYVRARESQRVGNVRLAERRCRQALYVDPDFLPALELLDTLWHSSVSARLRRALAARIHRSRNAPNPAEDAAKWETP